MNKEGDKLPGEKTVENYLIKKCKENNIIIIKNTGRNGIPDRLLLKNGKYVFVETKSTGEKPRPLQVEIIRRLKKQGAWVEVADTKEKIDKIIKKLCTGKEKSKNKSNDGI